MADDTACLHVTQMTTVPSVARAKRVDVGPNWKEPPDMPTKLRYD